MKQWKKKVKNKRINFLTYLLYNRIGKLNGLHVKKKKQNKTKEIKNIIINQ